MKNLQGKSTVVTIIVILLVLILFAVTNPKKDSHIQAIKNTFQKKDTVTSMLVQGILAVNPPQYHNSTLFSYTRYRNQLSTVGVVGYVWVDEEAFK